MFVDADDWLLPDCLMKLYQDMQNPGVGIAGCTFKSCTDSDWEKTQTDLQSSQAELQDQIELPVFIA